MREILDINLKGVFDKFKHSAELGFDLEQRSLHGDKGGSHCGDLASDGLMVEVKLGGKLAYEPIQVI